MPDPTTEEIQRQTDEREEMRAKIRALEDELCALRKALRRTDISGRPVPAYTTMTAGELVTACGDSAGRWAEAFVQHADRLGISQVVANGTDHPRFESMDIGWVIGWFANAMQCALDRVEHATCAPMAPVQIHPTEAERMVSDLVNVTGEGVQERRVAIAAMYILTLTARPSAVHFTDDEQRVLLVVIDVVMRRVQFDWSGYHGVDGAKAPDMVLAIRSKLSMAVNGG
jgi:hypothetical protein